MKFKERLTSKVFWIELVLIVAQVGKLTGLYEIDNNLLSSIQDFITVLFTIFASLNNPTNKTGF